MGPTLTLKNAGGVDIFIVFNSPDRDGDIEIEMHDSDQNSLGVIFITEHDQKDLVEFLNGFIFK